jgi:hypothetical protein
MRKLIGKIRRQPKQRRANIAFGIATSFTFVVAAIWLFNVPNTFNGALSTAGSPDQAEEGFFDRLGSQAAAVKDSISSDSSVNESLKELMDEYSASSTQASSTQPALVSASSTGTTTSAAPRESFERFTTDTSYEAEKPREIRIQAVPKATTSTTTSE